MQYPLMPKNIITAMQFVHAFFNMSIALLFCYQAWLGILIRKARRSSGQTMPLSTVKRHRKMGPVLIVLGLLGFFSGLTIVWLDTGKLLEFIPHFFIGLVIAVLLLATLTISRNIHGQTASIRNIHFLIGIIILCLYFVEVIIGAAVLF